MLLEDQVAAERLKAPSNLATRFKGNSRTNFYTPPGLNEVLRKLAGNDGKEDLNSVEATLAATLARAGVDTQENLAEEFGISQRGISRLKEGTSKVDEEAVARTLGKVEDLALEKLTSSLGFMTDEKLGKANVRDLSAIASNMSKVHSNLRGNSQAQGPLVSIQIWKPETRSEHNFKTIDL